MLTFEEKKARLAEINPEALLADGFEEALIGFATQFTNTFALYDRRKCIEILMGRGMDRDGAEEFFEFNTQGAWAGEYTPAFAELFKVTPDA